MSARCFDARINRYLNLLAHDQSDWVRYLLLPKRNYRDRVIKCQLNGRKTRVHCDRGARTSEQDNRVAARIPWLLSCGNINLLRKCHDNGIRCVRFTTDGQRRRYRCCCCCCCCWCPCHGPSPTQVGPLLLSP